jgi:hypothetical protein
MVRATTWLQHIHGIRNISISDIEVQLYNTEGFYFVVFRLTAVACFFSLITEDKVILILQFVIISVCDCDRGFYGSSDSSEQLLQTADPSNQSV